MRFPRKILVVMLATACGGDGGTGPTPPPAPVPTQLSVATQPSSTVQNGIALNTQPVIRLRDAQGVPAPASGVVVTASLSSGTGVTLANASATTNSSGIAAFTGLTLTGAVGSYTLRFSAPNLTAADANPIAVTPGAPTQLSVVTQPAAAAQAGVALATQPAVRLLDQSGNDVPAAGVTITASLVSGTMTIASSTALTDATGLATFSGLSLSGVAGSYTLRFTSGTLAPAVAAAPTVVSAGAASQLALTTAPSAGAANGAALGTQPVVQLRDAFGNDAAQAGVLITAGIVTGPAGAAISGDTVRTDANGRAAFSALTLTGPVGNYSLRFAATGFASIVAVTPVLLGAGAATRLGILTPPPLSAQSGVALTVSPVVQVQDQSGNAVAQPGVVITASLVTGTLTLANATVTTDAAGKATFTGLTLSGPVNAYLLRFTAPGLDTAVAGNATALLPGPAAALTLTTAPPATAVNGVALSTQPVVQLRDGQGNPVATAGVVIRAALVTGTVVLANDSATTNGAGVATFAGLSLTGTVGSYTLRFQTAATGVGTVDAPITLQAGAATEMVLVTAPATSATNGAALPLQPVVQLRDASGNAAPQANLLITATVATGPAGAVISGDTARTSAAGSAAFTALALTGPLGSYTLRFGAPGFTAIIAVTPVLLGAGAATQLGILTEPPSSAQSGVALTTTPVVQVQDQSGNAVTEAGIAITASAVSGTLAIANATALTDVTGKATFSGITLSGAAATYRLRFTASGLGTAIAAGTTALLAGPATALTLETPPPIAAVNAVALTTQPVVQLRDGQGNPVGTSGVMIRATLLSGTAVLAGDSAATDASGAATFSALAITGPVGSYTLRFSASAAGVGVVDAAPITLAAGAARRLTVATQPASSAVTAAPLNPQPAVQLRDTTGNLVAQAGVPVTATLVAGSATIANAIATTDAAGLATFAGLSISGPPGDYTLRFTSGVLIPVDAASAVTISAGAPHHLAIVTLPPASAVNGQVFGSFPVIEVLDVSDNPLAGESVCAATTGNVALSNAVAVTAANGRATFTGLTLTGQLAGYSLRFGHGTDCNATGIIVGSPLPTSLTAGPPAAVTLTSAPSAASQSGVALAAQPVARVTDVSGNTLAGVTVSVTTAAGASVANGVAVTGAGGLAAFTGLTVSGTPDGYTLTFTAGSASTGAPLTLSAGAPASIIIDVPPPAVEQNGEPFSPVPVVTVRDATGNPVPGVAVDANVASSAVAVSNATATTNAAGAATFTGLGLSGTAGTYAITFTAGTVQVTSSDVQLQPGNAASLTVTTQPAAAAQNSVPLSTQPAVHLEDNTANPLANRLVTATVTSGSVTLANAVATTDASGNAVFSGLTLIGAAGSYTLRFTSAGLSVNAAAPTALATGTASRLAVTATSATAQNGAALVTQPVITVTDDGGNPVALATTVTASVSSASVVLSNASAGTGGGSSATFSGFTLTGTAGAHTLTFSAPSLAAVTVPITLQAGAATQLAFVTQPSNSTVLNDPLPVQPVIRIADASGNTVSQAGVAISAGATSGGVTFGGTATVLTDGAGIASFTDLAINAPQGRLLLRFSGGGLADITAADTTVAAAPLPVNTPTLQSGGVNSRNPLAFDVPPGADSLVVTISGSGGADLLLRHNEAPDVSAGLWDCRPALGGSNETCSMVNPAAGTWYVVLFAFFSYSNITLTARIF